MFFLKMRFRERKILSILKIFSFLRSLGFPYQEKIDTKVFQKAPPKSTFRIKQEYRVRIHRLSEIFI